MTEIFITNAYIHEHDDGSFEQLIVKPNMKRYIIYRLCSQRDSTYPYQSQAKNKNPNLPF